jgi:acyl-homoserine lactone acylase PvdQ
MGDNPTARLLPPEFLTFGISKETWRPWSPVDSLAVFRLLSFHLSWNWMNDLMRESFR